MKKTNTTNLGKILQTNAQDIEEMKNACQQLYGMFISLNEEQQSLKKGNEDLQQENKNLHDAIESLRDKQQILEKRLSDLENKEMIDSNRTIQKGNKSNKNNSLDESFEEISQNEEKQTTFAQYIHNQQITDNLCKKQS